MTHDLDGGGRASCRSCGSTASQSELDAGGFVSCCPERSMNELIEQHYGVPALSPSPKDNDDE